MVNKNGSRDRLHSLKKVDEITPRRVSSMPWKENKADLSFFQNIIDEWRKPLPMP
jgi:hypothetical protein